MPKNHSNNNKNIILKADLHLHTHEDPQDYRHVTYSAFELIDYLENKGFDVFSITLHDYMFNDIMMKKIRKYAKNKGIIFIPGIEKTIDGFHTLIFNMKKEHAEKIDTYIKLQNTIKKYYSSKTKKDNLLIISAHPYFPLSTAIKNKINMWNKTIDGIEYNSFYLNWNPLNFNIKACKQAKLKNKLMIGNTDAHVLEQINNTYTNISIPLKLIINKKIPKNKEEFKKIIREYSDEKYDELNYSVIKSIKSKNTKIVTKPLKVVYVVKHVIREVIHTV